MSPSVKKLFQKSGSPESDGLSQTQREAIVDLLHFCMFADNFVALKEDNFINTVAATLSWDPRVSFESYEGGSIGNARRAKESTEFRRQFLEGIKSRLESKEVRTLAFELVKQLFSADANLAEQESQLLPTLKSALGLA